MLLVIDNYDSFTYNLVQYFGQLGVEQKVYRNDQITVEEALALNPDRVMISPGPCSPREAGLSKVQGHGRDDVAHDRGHRGQHHEREHEVSIALVGKYAEHRDAYKSIYEALDHGGIARRTQVRVQPIKSEDIEREGAERLLAGFDGLVVPGVGAFGACMEGLRAVHAPTIIARRLAGGRPVLGICVGMQLLADVGREHGDHKGLGWIPGEVVRIDPHTPSGEALKVPHMGWNSLALLQPHPLLDGMAEGTDVYFVHSYAIRPGNPSHVIAVTDYGGPVPAIVGRDNIVGTQFHPEKSHRYGMELMRRFAEFDIA